jgi:hypothetical protein
MPASSPDTRHSEGAVRDAVIRLSRPDGEGGAVIERAAILAEGTPAAAIEEWVISHGGEPEVPTFAAHAPGLYGQRTTLGGPRSPQRYVFPAAALGSSR